MTLPTDLPEVEREAPIDVNKATASARSHAQELEAFIDRACEAPESLRPMNRCDHRLGALLHELSQALLAEITQIIKPELDEVCQRRLTQRSLRHLFEVRALV